MQNMKQLNRAVVPALFSLALLLHACGATAARGKHVS